MIVDSMTHEEVYKELERDRENLTRWLSHQLERKRRTVIKAQRLPVKFWLEYTSPRKVNYLIYGRVFEKHKNIFCMSHYALHRKAGGFEVYLTWPHNHEGVWPMVYLPHVFTQYALPERANVQKKGIELVKHFLSRNDAGIDSYNQHVVGKSVRYNGELHLSCCVSEGVLLGHMVGHIYEARTFITYDMCKGLQHGEFGECRSILPSEKAGYEIAKNNQDFFYL